jgi:protein disulfide-isomerase
MSSRLVVRNLVALAVIWLPVFARAQSPGIAWRNNLDTAKIEAARSGRLLLLHFWSPTCYPCKVLDQNVLSQPHVGAAVEREYVPVKIDAEAEVALARAFRIEHVPTDVVLTPQGNIVATLAAPKTPDDYLTQLQDLARHFRQTTMPAGVGSATVNPAYAGLPGDGIAHATASNPPYGGPASAPVLTTYATAAGGGAQAQANPYYSPGTPVTYATQPAPGASADASTSADAASGSAVMPNNAMPQSYRNPMFSDPTATPSDVAASVAAPTAGVAVSGAPSGRQGVQNSAVAAVPSQTTVAAPVVVAKAKPPLPPNCPPVGFDGCCPVTLKTLNRWTAGDTAFGAIHRGRTYLFAGEAERRQFLADPDGYSPVFAGFDPVLLLDKQQSVPGSRKFGYRYGGAFYLFCSKETMARFEASPQTYAAGVRQAMNRLDATAGGVMMR